MSYRANIITFLSALLFSISFHLAAQEISGRQKAEEQIFTARVKQFGEFTSRFNSETDFNGKKADSAFLLKMPRAKMISLLFDLHNPKLDERTTSYSPVYAKDKSDFAEDVARTGAIIDQHSPLIIAESKSRVKLRGKILIISIFLSQEVSQGATRWVIRNVTGLSGEIFRSDTTMIRFIPPASNETGFLNLKRALDDSNYLQYYAYSGFRPDELTLFFSCINSGVLQYEYSEEVIYHVFSIPGWYFTVRDFNRNELNSGWLISDLRKGDYSPEMLTAD